MLEPILKNIVEEIKKVTIAHCKILSETTMLSRDWEFIFSDFDGWVVLYCSTYNTHGDYWVYPTLFPESKIESLKETLPQYNILPPSEAYSHVIGGDKHWIEPFWHEDENFYSSEIPIFFHREHYGRPKGEESYIEFNQIVTHPLELHWSEIKQALCSVNDSGDEVEKIKIIRESDITLVTIRRKTLDKLLHLGQWVLVRYVDFTRREKDFYNYQGVKSKTVVPPEYEAKYEIRSCGLKYVEFRGAQIERPKTPKEKVLSFFEDEELDERKYATFTVYDWKNKAILENYSLSPENFANYFTESDLPFETSPIFFKAEVIDKYKHNPDKYEVSERTISCRGGWYLQTYDINEYNQIHTYAVYLSRLPYTEQLHWLQYNEKPKGGLSKRAFRTDFEGEFPEDKSVLEELKESLDDLTKVEIENISSPIWTPKGGSWENASKGLYLVLTENPNQWHDFIIALANTVNEGFQKKTLKQIALVLGNKDDFGTLGLIKFILKAKGRQDLIAETHAILNDLQEKRSQGKAHGAWNTPRGSLIQDSKDRTANVVLAIRKLCEFFKTL